MFSFYKHRWVFFGISIAVIVTGIALCFILGTKLDIQFKGGSIVTYKFKGDIALDEAERQVAAAIGQNVSAQKTESVVDKATSLVISVAGDQALTPDQLNQMQEALKKAFPKADIELGECDLVAPFIGREMLINGVLAIIVASVLIIAFVWFAFRTMSGPSAGVMALIALFHDILVAFFVFIVTGTPLNETTVAVVLTILGFSINDTIVIYDRIRENVRLTNGSMPLADLVDKSIMQSFTRSVNTSLATFVAVTVAYIFSRIYGISSISEFALPMMVGVISGSYSSIALASPLWVCWKTRGGRTGYEK